MFERSYGARIFVHRTQLATTINAMVGDDSKLGHADLVIGIEIDDQAAGVELVPFSAAHGELDRKLVKEEELWRAGFSPPFFDPNVVGLKSALQ